MKQKLLFFAVLLMAMAIPQSVKATINYDFSAAVPSGQTLYFKYATGGKVMVTYPNYYSTYKDYYYCVSQPTGNLVIPASVSVNGVMWDIMGVDDYAFYQCTGLTSVTIECPGSVKSNAFYGCTGITNLIVGDSVSSIGTNAFLNCSNINTVILGENVISIGASGFGGCYSLSSITSFATTPPTATSTTFNGVSANCSIIVPVASTTAYGAATGWSQFVNITGMASSISATVYPSNAIMGTVSVSHTANIFTLTANANDNYHFVQWNDGNTDNPRTLTLTADATFTAQFAPNQYTINGSTLSNGIVTGGGVADYLDSVTLTAIPNEGYYFSKWSTWTGATYEDYSTDNPLTVQVTSNMTYYATFEQITCNVEAQSSNSLMGYTTGGGVTYYGSTVQLQAYANTGYRFVSWSDGVTLHNRSIYVISDITLTAIFEAIPQYVVSVGSNNSERGTANGGGTYYENETVTLTATPAMGCHFIGWSDGINSNPRIVIVDKDTTFTAMFELTDFVITAQTNNSLRGAVNGTDTVHYGQTVTLTATPSEHFTFHYWQTSSGTTFGDNPLTITVTSSDTYTANFAAEQHSVVVLSDGGGTVRIGNSGNNGNYDYFSQLTLTATANGNNAFLRWSDGNSFNPRTVTITQDTIFTALFLNGTTFLHDTIYDTVYFNHYTHDTTYINNYVHDTMFFNNNYHDTTYINNYIYDTIINNVFNYDTSIIHNYQYDTVIVHTYQYDTTVVNVYDTTFVNYYQYDTTIVNNTTYNAPIYNSFQYDTTFVFDTVIVNVYNHDTSIYNNYQFDTVILNTYQYDTTLVTIYDTVINNYYKNDTTIINIQDSVVINHYFHDTTFVYNYIHDTVTAYINRYTHDTTYINNYVHDTLVQYVNQYIHDTAFVNNYVHDTLIQYVNQYVHDTTFVNNYVHDTVWINTHVFDTTIVNIYHFDTSIYSTYNFDTTIINNHYYDTIVVHIHDTIYITEEGIDGVEGLNAKVYSSRGQIVVEGANGNQVWLYDAVGRLLATRQDDYSALRFDVPATGTYLIKVGNHPARRVVVIR